jgi:hypothetical protein
MFQVITAFFFSEYSGPLGQDALSLDGWFPNFEGAALPKGTVSYPTRLETLENCSFR